MIIQILITLFVLFALSRVVIRFRAGEMTPRECLFWFFFWVVVGGVGVYPNVASWLAIALGVGRGADAIVYVALLAIFYILFRIFTRIERIERNITALVREIALRDARHGHDHEQAKK
ncbi:DUF2304 family protein [Candidatus Uhrbacteria bacterium]|nr:DUF2304 family protein [Candidatus Uhrbacteria bacterium]